MISHEFKDHHRAMRMRQFTGDAVAHDYFKAYYRMHRVRLTFEKTSSFQIAARHRIRELDKQI